MVFRGPMFFFAHAAFGNTDSSSEEESQAFLRIPGRIVGADLCVCNRMYDPVCYNGQTYSSTCTLECDVLQRKLTEDDEIVHGACSSDDSADTSAGDGNRVLMEDPGFQSLDEEEDLYWRAHRPCAENPCLNGGTCIDFLDYGLDGPTFTCECDHGFGGINCQTVIFHRPVTLPARVSDTSDEVLEQILEVLRVIAENKRGKNISRPGIGEGQDGEMRLTESHKQAKHFSTLIAALLKHTLDIIFGATKVFHIPASSNAEPLEDGDEEHNARTPIDLTPYMKVMREVDELLGDLADISYHVGSMGEVMNDSFRAKHMPGNFGKKIGKWIRGASGLNVNIRELLAVNIEGVLSLVQKIGERFDFTKPEAGKQIIEIAQQGDLVIVILELIHPLVIEELQFFGKEDYEMVARHVGELFITVVNDFLSLDYKHGVFVAIKSLFTEIRIQDKLIDGVAQIYGDVTEVWCWQEEREQEKKQAKLANEARISEISGPTHNRITLPSRFDNYSDEGSAEELNGQNVSVDEGTSNIDGQDRRLTAWAYNSASVGKKSSSCNSKDKIRRWSERVKTMLSVIEYILKDVYPKFMDEGEQYGYRSRPVGGLRYQTQNTHYGQNTYYGRR